MSKIKELWTSKLWFKVLSIIVGIMVVYKLGSVSILLAFFIGFFALVIAFMKYALKKPTRFKARYLLLATVLMMFIGGSNPSAQSNQPKNNHASLDSSKAKSEKDKAASDSKKKAASEKSKNESKKKEAASSSAKAKKDSESKASSISASEASSKAVEQASSESKRISDEQAAAAAAQQASIAASQSQQAAASSQAAAAAAQAPVSTGGYTKDNNGRWHRPNGKFASKAEIAQAGLAW